MTFAIIFDSVGVGEWFVLLAVVLIVVGPKRLPSTARKFGQYYSKFRRAADGFKRQLLEMDTEFTNAISEAEREVEKAASEVENAANDVTSDITGDATDGVPNDVGVEPGDYGGYNPDDYRDSTEPPAEEPPATEPSATETPATEAPSAETPAEQPKDEPPAPSAPTEP